MEEKPQKKNVRDSLAEQFIKILESNEPLQWVKTWSSGRYSLPYNGQSERRYNGINRMILMFKAMEMGWSDPRYYTFHQVSQMDGCKIRAGEKATAVEYWLVRDTKEKRSMTFSDYEKLLKDDPSRKEVEFYAYPKVAYVFNAAQVEGLKLLPQPERPPLEENKLADEVIKTMAENMEVRLIYGGNEAYYRPDTDSVHLPPRDSFFTTDDLTSTTLHELAHATSSPTRLDRPITGYYQDPESYAKEELFAELASVYASAELGLKMSDSVINNHAAYVQHWIAAIKENSNVLFTALKEADKIADYLIEKGRVQELKEKLTLAAQVPKIASETAPQIHPGEALYLVDDTTYLHVQPTEGGWDYSLYDKETKKLLDGGLIETAAIEESPVRSLAGAVRTEVFAIQGMTPTSVVYMDPAVLEELQAAQMRDGSVSYEIWQLKGTPENKGLLFSDYAYASLFRLDESRYDKVYEAKTGPNEFTLSELYYKFNVDHPADFKGHSLSTSDVIVMNDNGKKNAYYVDRVGFREVSNFCKPQKQTEKRGRAR